MIDEFDVNDGAAPPVGRPDEAAGFAPISEQRRVQLISRTALADAAQVSLIGLFVLALIVALRLASEILVPLTAALVLGFVLNPVAARMERRGVPGAGAAAILMVAIGLVLYGLTYAMASPMQQWAQRLPDLISAVYHQAMTLRASMFHTTAEAAPPDAGSKQLLDLISSTGILSSAALTAPSVLGEIALFAVALFFLLALRQRMRAGLLALCVKRRSKITTAHILHDIEKRVSAYLATITMINFGVGVLATIAMWLLGVPNPALWGVLAALLNFAPYLGPAIMVTIMAGVSLTTFHHLAGMVAPPLAIAAIFFLEGNFFTPAIVGHRFTLNPLLVLISLSFWLWLWGPIGAVLAVPLLIIFIVVLTYVALPQIAERAIAERRRESRQRTRPVIAPITPPPHASGTVKMPAPPHL